MAPIPEVSSRLLSLSLLADSAPPPLAGLWDPWLLALPGSLASESRPVVESPSMVLTLLIPAFLS